MPHVTHYFKTSVGFFIDILIYFILNKKLKEFLHLVSWLRSVGRKIRKVSSYLVRAKLYLLERRVGSFKCGGRRCQVCLNVTETETFTSTSTNQTYKINHEFNCNESSLMYLLTCKICRKQYVWAIRFSFTRILGHGRFKGKIYGHVI